MNQMTRKVIVTGSTGQDGSYMIEYLLANTENTIIAALRRTSQAILGNLKDVLDNPRVKLVTVDLCDGEAMRSLIREERPDYFINFGAQTFVGDSWKNPVAHMQTNAISLIAVLEAVREYVPQCRVYSAGSSEQYGNVEYSPQDEKHPNRPRSVYGVSKVTAQQLCKVYRESYGLYVVHGILFNHESPRRQDYFVTRKITKGVARIARAIKDGVPFEPIELGNLDAKRDWSHAKDFVDGVWKMLNQNYRSHPGIPAVDIHPDYYEEFHRRMEADEAKARAEWEPNEYVLSSNETHSIREFVEKAFVAAGFDNGGWYNPTGEPGDERFELRFLGGQFDTTHQTYSSVTETDTVRRVGQHVSGLDWNQTVVRINPAFYRPCEVELLWGDSTRARTELGWTPQHSFEQLVTEMVAHDLKQVGL